MKLASGAAPVEKLLAAGIAVGLGTDAWCICKMASINGARALGMDREIGTLEVGKAADLIAVRTDTPRMTPLLSGPHLNLPHNLVHADKVNRVAPGLFARRTAWLQQNGVGVQRGDESPAEGLFRL